MPLHSLARRFTIGAAFAAAAFAMLLAHPQVALAHHVKLSDDASCDGWTVRAEYIGGDEDRMVVVDAWINDEHIDETFFFDEGTGHLGHQDYFLLYERSGTGSLQTSGTVTMYARDWRGRYKETVDEDYTGIDLVCATPTPPVTATPIATDTPVPTATSTPTPDDTPETSGSVTPLPTDTPDTTIESTITPLPTETSTPSAQGSTTPLPTNTPSRSRSTRTATTTSETPAATPTFTDEVRGGTPPAQPPAPDSPSGGEGDTPETGTGLPDAGDGGMDGVSFLLAVLGFALVIVGAATILSARTVRSRK
jgi:hypothetical protein